jgi:hypothetical protein
MRRWLLSIMSIMVISLWSPIIVLADEPPETTIILATLRLEGGGLVQFLKTQSGEILIIEQAPTDKAQEIAERPPGMTPSELFEYLSGEPAPDALVEAEENATTAIEEPDVEEALATGPQPYVPQETPTTVHLKIKISDDWFRRIYCKSSGYSYSRCWVRTTCSRAYPGCGMTGYGAVFSHVVNALQGNVTMRLQEWDGRMWRDSRQSPIVVYEGGLSKLSVFSWQKRWRRAIVYNAQNDIYHNAIYGR